MPICNRGNLRQSGQGVMTKLRCLAYLVVLLGSACATSDDGWRPFNPGVASPAETCPPDGPNSFYFPSGVLDDDAFRRQWYSEALTAMREPSLSCGVPIADETYRFLWLRSFDQPIAVRIARTGEHYELDAVVLNGAGGYSPGRVLRRVRRTLSQSQWEQTVSALEGIGFWTMPTTKLVLATDGAQWIIEGRGDHYHVVDRWGGDDGVRRVGLTFLNLSEISISADLIY